MTDFLLIDLISAFGDKFCRKFYKINFVEKFRKCLIGQNVAAKKRLVDSSDVSSTKKSSSESSRVVKVEWRVEPSSAGTRSSR